MSDVVPGGVRLGIVRSISYGLFGKPDRFVPQLRELGATLVRVYFYWSQIEPEPGRYVFDAVDAFLDQLDGSEEVWVTVCSSSPWATRQATTFLPPSPAKDADPSAAVVLGGAPYELPASAPDSPERRFFDVLLRDGRDAFDLFDLHLYGEVSRIPADVEAARGLMRAFGYEKPLVVGEYNGPWPNLYPEATAAMQEALAAAFATPVGGSDRPDGAAGGQPTPEQAAMAGLYERMPSLPPQLQMFMRGCPPELEDKRHRINCREMVMRNLLALSAGVRRTVCWNLAPDVPGYQNPLSVMDLLFGKLALMDYQGTELRHRYPAAETFALLAAQLARVDGVVRLEVPARHSLCLFEVRRGGRGPLLVVWDERDSFSGEDELPVAFDWPWPAPRATVVDAFGQVRPVELRDGRVALQASLTPLFIAAD